MEIKKHVFKLRVTPPVQYIEVLQNMDIYMYIYVYTLPMIPYSSKDKLGN